MFLHDIFFFRVYVKRNTYLTLGYIFNIFLFFNFQVCIQSFNRIAVMKEDDFSNKMSVSCT